MPTDPSSARRTADRPLAYAPGDSVGICLDVDGTIYPGSIFVETLGYLPYATDLPLSEGDLAARRRALLAVAEYADGERGRRHCRRILAALDALDRVGSGRLAARTADLLRRLATGDRESSDAAAADRRDYERMQRRLLGAYGDLLADKSRTAVRRAADRTVGRYLSVDPDLRETLARVERAGDAETVLVTHAPAHVARPYADRLLGDPDRVVATRYATDGAGRFTGDYETPAKGEAVDRLVARREWDHVVAAGDSRPDLAMAERAAVFLAVVGEGNLVDHVDEGVDGTRRIVRVPGVEATAGAVSATLSAIGLLEP